jgi:NAD(P)-dependent dehydrogenase (short-subunit alcohol dehydrogenase family)
MYGPQRIRANAVAPGPTMTGIEGQMRSELAMQRVPPLMGAVGLRIAQPEELAAVIIWLLSDDASNVNGAILPSDGGWSVA